jgi:hypothetical protein
MNFHAPFQLRYIRGLIAAAIWAILSAAIIHIARQQVGGFQLSQLNLSVPYFTGIALVFFLFARK